MSPPVAYLCELNNSTAALAVLAPLATQLHSRRVDDLALKAGYSSSDTEVASAPRFPVVVAPPASALQRSSIGDPCARLSNVRYSFNVPRLSYIQHKPDAIPVLES